MKIRSNIYANKEIIVLGICFELKKKNISLMKTEKGKNNEVLVGRSHLGDLVSDSCATALIFGPRLSLFEAPSTGFIIE